MSTKKIHSKGQEGIALILALFFLFGLTTMATVMANRLMAQHRDLSTYVNYQKCLQGIEAGIAHAKAEIFRAQNDVDNELDAAVKDGRIGLSTDFDLEAGGVPTFADTNAVTPWNSETLPELEFFAYSYDWSSDGRDNNGNDPANPDEEAEEGYWSIIVHSRMKNVSRSVEVVLQAKNVNVWQNAIFAGQGQGGGVINGNVSIHGSVHILGENLEPGDEAINALALTGSSIIANSYCCGGGSGLSDDMRDRVPAPETVDFMGELGLETVEAIVRVKNGSVSLNGSANLGLAPDITFGENDRKESLDGVYVNNNWADPGDDGIPVHVYSDNGTAAAYDLGDAMDFPTFADDAGEAHLAYYLEDFDLGTTADNEVFNGDIEIEAGGDDFYWNATTRALTYSNASGMSNMTESGTFPASPPTEGNFIWFNASTKEMVIRGRIPVSGDIRLLSGNGAQNRKITYSGVGSFLAYDGGTGGGPGNVTVQVSLVTPESTTTDANGDPVPTFPVNVIGIMAANDISLGGGAHLDLMGGFYAQETIVVDQQATIMGTIVGNDFELSQVPDVYQVMPLAEALTGDAIRMIGSEPVIVLIKVSWRELGVG